MHRSTILLLAATVGCGGTRDERAVRTDSAPDTTAAAPNRWTVSLRDAGGVPYGALLATADSLTGRSDGGCGYVRHPDAPAGMAFMVEQGHVVRVDVDSGGVLTDRGVGVGATEADVRRAYPDSIETLPHKYEPASRYLTVVPRDSADRARRIVFEVDSTGRVMRYRAGLRPAVEYVERCG